VRPPPPSPHPNSLDFLSLLWTFLFRDFSWRSFLLRRKRGLLRCRFLVPFIFRLSTRSTLFFPSPLSAEGWLFRFRCTTSAESFRSSGWEEVEANGLALDLRPPFLSDRPRSVSHSQRSDEALFEIRRETKFRDSLLLFSFPLFFLELVSSPLPSSRSLLRCLRVRRSTGAPVAIRLTRPVLTHTFLPFRIKRYRAISFRVLQNPLG